MSKTAIIPAESKSDRLPMILTGQALMSLRDSGFSLPTALAEVVDNSIEARANFIRIRLDEAEAQGKKHVHRIVISDDGEGMEDSLLHHYLQIGFSSRYMSRETIGKYGVGAKLAALNFAKRIDVWSRRAAEAEWMHVVFDLDTAMEDEKSSGRSVGIDKPAARPVPDDIAALAPKGSGTIVAWSAIDRLEHGRIAADFNALRVDLEKELSRIFREFIDGGIKIEVNSRALLPHDPLLMLHHSWADKALSEAAAKAKDRKKPTPDHFGAKVLTDDLGDPIRVAGSEARVRITLYPPEVTRKRNMGGDKLALQLRVPDNEGAISFMRMKREIAYTTVPRAFPLGVKDMDRFIGVEVSFNPDLDEYFGVRNVKRGVEPHGELREKIRAVLRKYVPMARKEIEERWGKASRDDLDHEGEHAPIMDAVKDVDSTMPKSRTPEVASDQVKTELENLAADTGHADTQEKKDDYIERIRALPFVVESMDFPGKAFIDVRHLNNQVIIRLNTRHRFYRELWAPLSDIAHRDPGTVSGDDAVKASRRAVEGLALLIVAYGKAQSMDDQPDKYDDLTSYWGQFVDTLMGKVKDVI